MILTVTGRIASIGEGKDIKGSDNQPLAVIDFQLALDRGNYKKRVSMLNGKEYDSDFYKVSLFGQSALSFKQYASVGREIQVSGRFVQEEFLSKDQLVQIAPTNPLFPYFAQLVGKVADVVGAPDGNIYIKGNHPVNRTTFVCQEYRWTQKNPNAQPQQGFASFQPQPQANFSANTFGGAQTPSFGGATAGFGGVAPQATFGAQVPATTFGSAPAPNGFGAPVASFGGFGAQAPTPTTFGVQPQAPAQSFGGGQQYIAPQQQVQPTNYPGFGGESVAPADFTANGNMQGFTGMPIADESAQGFANFTPDTNGAVNVGFTPAPTAPVNNPTTPVTPGTPNPAVNTNIPPAPTNDEARKEIATGENQGF